MLTKAHTDRIVAEAVRKAVALASGGRVRVRKGDGIDPQVAGAAAALTTTSARPLTEADIVAFAGQGARSEADTLAAAMKANRAIRSGKL